MKILQIFAMFAATALALSTTPSLAQEEIRLWPAKAPGSETWAYKETVIDNGQGRIVGNVSDPTLTVFLPPPEKATGTAILIAPGGGLRVLAIDGEGTKIAHRLNARGIAAFVLKYRVRQHKPDSPAPGSEPRTPVKPLQELDIKNGNANPVPDDAEMNKVLSAAVADAQQALKLVRRNSAKWHVDPNKVGMMGFSAGGGVSVGAALGPKGVAYPDFVISLFGPALQDVSVPDHAPPLFLAVRQDHFNVAPGLIALFVKWREARKPAELHVYDMANGNIGLNKSGTPIDTWLDRVLEWMALRGYAPAMTYDNVR